MSELLDINITKLENQINEILQKLKTTNNRELYPKLDFLSKLLNLNKEIKKIKEEINNLSKIISNSNESQELQYLAKQEINELTLLLNNKERELKYLNLEEDPYDQKNVILEIRAGIGGEEAALFSADLFRMYTKFATSNNWGIDVLSISESEKNGIKEIITKISGKNVYKKLKYESGIHRVQRIPITESSGRIHTSAASVVVIPEIDDVKIEIKPEELRIDTYRSSGHGGQSVNTTFSAVRIVHIPTGIVVTCQNTKDQHQNKETALSILKSRLHQLEIDKQKSQLSKIRKESIKTGDRSDKIKTYNFLQDRLTDHRIKRSWFGLEKILNGELEEILEETAILIGENKKPLND